MTLVAAIIMGLAASVCGAAGASGALRFLRRRRIVDKPNERSSHSEPTPRGLGIAIVPVVVLSWMGIAAMTPSKPAESWWICAGAFGLAVISWIDDVRGLPVTPRLLTQVVAVLVGVVAFGPPSVFPGHGIPSWVGGCAVAILWLGLINQVNFTDGIDGNMGTALVCVGVGIFVVATLGKAAVIVGAFSLILAGACAGFLVVNWAPAKGFMGDVGSVPLGYLTGWLLLRTASYGLWVPVAILPLFYFADTAVTYSRRIARRTKFWRPHREYLYQRAAQALGHAPVVLTTAFCNVLLLGCAALAVQGFLWVAVLGATAVVATTYALLARSTNGSLERGRMS